MKTRKDGSFSIKAFTACILRFLLACQSKGCLKDEFAPKMSSVKMSFTTSVTFFCGVLRSVDHCHHIMKVNGAVIKR